VHSAQRASLLQCLYTILPPSPILVSPLYRYSYSKTRGLFGGVSVEGSVIVERQDANSHAYHAIVSSKQILSGGVTPPDWAQPLIRTLESCTSPPGGRAWVADDRSPGGSSYAFGGIASNKAEVSPSQRKQPRNSSTTPSFPPDSWGTRRNSGSYFGPPREEAISGSAWDYDQPPRIDDPSFETRFENDFAPTGRSRAQHAPGQSLDSSMGARLPPAHSRSSSSAASAGNPFYSQAERESDGYDIASPFGPTLEDEGNPFGPGSRVVDATVARYRETERDRVLRKPLAQGEGVCRAIALFDFRAVEPGDLSFSKGQVITITEKNDSTDTW
jgi:SH3 domain-containing YSC84-like protein 1